jgi:hypothetical protein
MHPRLPFIAAVLALCLVHCKKDEQQGPEIEPDEPVPDEPKVPDEPTVEEIELDQGWTEDTQRGFYSTAQGSEIMPYAWILALEQAGSETRFLDDANIERYRYLPRAPSDWNPDGMPIGWTRGEDGQGKAWFGLNCSACHTGMISYENPATKKVTLIRIDGAPTLADFNLMNLELVAALQATLADADKFGRFAVKILKNEDSESTRAALRGEVEQITEALNTRNEINKTDVHYGFARIDAIGFIFNQTMSTLPGIPGNAKPSDAPASYPFLWGTDQSDVVQWTGFAANASGAGTLIRNGGEVIGVYGKVALSKKDTYASSLMIENLGDLEDWVRELRAPVWPDVLPPVDKAKAAKGAPLFEEMCASCHQVVPSADQGKAYQAVITSIDELGTDPTELDNMLERKYAAGVYKGKKMAVLAGAKITDPTTGLNPLINAVAGSLLHSSRQAIEGLLDEHATKTKTAQGNVNGYKARPLNGIWATAPFLHNGAVPNLYELLLPAADRSKTFTLGSRAFDPERVGYAMDQPTTAKGYTPFTFDTSLRGNSNAGHEYLTRKDGTPLTDEQRWQLVEYMKTL